MKYALGCAFTLGEMLINFPYKKLQITCKDCKAITGDNHRDLLVKRVFKESVKLVIEDIIENNITFWLPLTGDKKCNMHMKRVSGQEFKNLRKGGKWKDIDFVKSMFSGYEIRFFMLGKRTPRVKTIYLNKSYRERIAQRTNEGIQYGDGVNDKTINDYYDAVCSMFPSIPKVDIERILKFCWKSLYLHNSYGGDVLLSGPDFWFYIGNLRKDSLQHFYYYIRKLTVKLRVLYKRKEVEWDGYYYFALSQSQYQKYQEQKNKRGRPRKNFSFGSIYLYQILNECKINEHYKQYIFRVPFISLLKTKQFIQDFKSSTAELIIQRSPLKFKDILVNNNEYEFL